MYPSRLALKGVMLLYGAEKGDWCCVCLVLVLGTVLQAWEWLTGERAQAL